MNIEELSLVCLAEKIRSGELSSVEVVSRFAEKIEANRHLNALIYFNKAKALDEAARLDRVLVEQGPVGRLHGVPLVIKDNIHVRDVPNTAGSPALESFVPKEDAETVRALRDAGAVILAKTSMSEFAFGSTSMNSHFGHVKCVHNLEHTSGGSSGGTAAAVASWQAPAGLGTDTGGSVRVPSAINGLCGLRPSSGRYSQDGCTPMSRTRDTIGPMAHSCEDLLLLDELITGETHLSHEPIDLKQLRIGIPKGYLCSDLDSEVAKAFEEAKRLMSHHGLDLVDVDMSEIERLDSELGLSIINYELAECLSAYLRANEIPLTFEQLVVKIASPDIREIFETMIVSRAPQRVSRETYQHLIDVVRPQLIDAYKRLFAETRVHLLAYPTMAGLAPRFVDISDNISNVRRMLRNSSPSSNAGTPCLTIPVASVDRTNLKIGLNLEALFGQDQYLLKCGAAIHNLFSRNQEIRI